MAGLFFYFGIVNVALAGPARSAAATCFGLRRRTYSFASLYSRSTFL